MVNCPNLKFKFASIAYTVGSCVIFDQFSENVLLKANCLYPLS